MQRSKWIIAGASGIMLSTVASGFALASTSAIPVTLIVSEWTNPPAYMHTALGGIQAEAAVQQLV